MKAQERILVLCKEEVSAILRSQRPSTLQDEQLLSPVIKYLTAFANNPDKSTETQVTRNLSIPRPATRRIMETLEAYNVIQPIADFGTVKPYKVSSIGRALAAAWVRFSPEEAQLLFGVRDAAKFDHGSPFFSEGAYAKAEDGTRWLPPMGAASSFFRSIVHDLDLTSRFEYKDSAHQVDTIYLAGLLQDAFDWPITLGDLMLLGEKESIASITTQTFQQTRKRLAETYCRIYYQIAEKMLSLSQTPAREYLSYMAEVLDSCKRVAGTYGAEKTLIQQGDQLITQIHKLHNAEKKSTQNRGRRDTGSAE